MKQTARSSIPSSLGSGNTNGQDFDEYSSAEEEQDVDVPPVPGVCAILF